MSVNTKVLGIYGKKGSGKDTIANFIKEHAYELDFPHEAYDNITPVVKIYHFADKIKEFCVDYLELKRELLYGTDDDKNTISHITWGKMPHYLKIVALAKFKGEEYPEEKKLMTYREIMQQVGTEWFEPINPNIWIEKCFQQINNDICHYALIADVRFRKEVNYLHENGHEILKLTRDIANSKDKHKSEIDCDGMVFEYEIRNHKLSLEETYSATLDLLDNMGWMRNERN